jgi:aminomethyltransferase
MFDVSHMCVIDLHGPGVRAFLRWLLANDIGKLQRPGKALYSCMLAESGGVIDDLIVYFMNEQWFRLVVNAGPRDSDVAWMRAVARETVSRLEIIERVDLAMIAVQGPAARDRVAELLAPEDRAPALARRRRSRHSARTKDPHCPRRQCSPEVRLCPRRQCSPERPERREAWCRRGRRPRRRAARCRHAVGGG